MMTSMNRIETLAPVRQLYKLYTHGFLECTLPCGNRTNQVLRPPSYLLASSNTDTEQRKNQSVCDKDDSPTPLHDSAVDTTMPIAGTDGKIVSGQTQGVAARTRGKTTG